MLASGSFDKTISIIDCRNASVLPSVPLPADIESLAWDPFQSNHLYCSLEDGQVLCVDIRLLNNAMGATGKSQSHAVKNAIVCQFQAHEQTVSSLDFSSTVPGLCATSSIDETVKIWDMHAATASSQMSPKNIFYKTMNVGNLFSINFSKDDPFLLATGGDGGIVAVWDCDEQQVIKDYFEGRELKKGSNPYASLRSAEAEGESDLKVESLENEEEQEGEDGMELVKKTIEDGELKKKKKKSKKKSNA
jgi:periodic tryptophan protein 1